MKIIDSNTRFYIDIDMETKTIIGWDYGQKQEIERELPNPNQRRIFITQGQYNKLLKNK